MNNTKYGKGVGLMKIKIFLLIIIATGIFILCININEHWIYSYDNNGPVYSTFAKNYLKHGYFSLKFGQLMSPRMWGEGLDSQDLLRFYIDHPPLLSILISWSFKIFGVMEFSARVIPILFSALSIVLVFLISKKLYNEKIAVLSSFFFTFTPMILFFGKMPNFEPIVNFFVLIVVYSYLLWADTYKRKYLFFTLFTYFLGMIAWWPAYYLGAIIPLHYLVFNKGKKRILVITLFPFLAFIMFAAFILHVLVLEGFLGITSLISKFFRRAGGDFGLFEFFITEARYLDYGFTPILILLSLFYIFSQVIKYKRKEYKQIESDSVILLLYSVALTHVILFKEGALDHPFWIFFFCAPLSICAANTVYTLAKSQGINGKDTTISTKVVALFLILFLLMSYPRTNYYNSSKRLESYQLGTLINKNTKHGDTVITSLDYSGAHLSYYADRDIGFGVDNIARLKKLILNSGLNCKYFIIPSNMSTPDELINYLKDNYKSFVQGGYIFYYISESAGKN